MATVVFKGRVFPAALNLTMQPPLTVGWKDNPRLPDGQIEITISNGAVTCKCEISKYEHSVHFGYLYKEAYELTAIALHFHTFATGDGIIFILETVTAPDGQTTFIRYSQPNLAQHCTAFALNNTLEAIQLMATEPLARFALNDLNESVAVPNRTTVNCGRVIETIRHMIHPTAGDADRRPAWLKMQEVLNLGPNYMKIIRDNSLSHRHGSFAEVDAMTNGEITIRTWQIMNRFLEYRKRGKQPLAQSDFPLLD